MNIKEIPTKEMTEKLGLSKRYVQMLKSRDRCPSIAVIKRMHDKLNLGYATIINYFTEV